MSIKRYIFTIDVALVTKLHDRDNVILLINF